MNRLHNKIAKLTNIMCGNKHVTELNLKNNQLITIITNNMCGNKHVRQ